MKNSITPNTNPRFYEVAHEFGLVVDNETRGDREGRRSDEYKIWEKEEKMKLNNTTALIGQRKTNE